MNNLELDTLRSQIDEIDTKLCQLIKERQSLASKIMNAKEGAFPFDPNREEELIKKLVSLGLDKFLVEKVWRQIISSNLSMQKLSRLVLRAMMMKLNQPIYHILVTILKPLTF